MELLIVDLLKVLFWEVWPALETEILKVCCNFYITVWGFWLIYETCFFFFLKAWLHVLEFGRFHPLF